ncbi:uncharacterized protein LOC135692767 [Rhopilema esculentum]|uniref:uncharacterized protein LOC135692767 n=1 Tax=Rhopilema esculentum TaxID=499914 RepID=UPI0031D1AFAC
MMDKLSKYEPVDFKFEDVEAELDYQNASSKKKKLVLIQAPANFNINSLTGLQIPLNGEQILPSQKDSDKRYEVKSSWSCKRNMESINILIPSFEERKLYVGRPLYGSMVVTQSIRIPPVVTPDREEVTLPTVSEKLIHKWTPFGADSPKKLYRKEITKRKKEVKKRCLEELSSSTSNSQKEVISEIDRTHAKDRKKKKNKRKDNVSS